MNIQTISTHSHARHAHGHGSRHDRDTSAVESPDSPNASADESRGSGTFMRAVFSVFAGFASKGSNGVSGSTSDDATRQPADGGAEIQITARLKVEGSATSSNDLMQALQSFASSLFNSLHALFDGSSGQPQQQANNVVPATTSSAGTTGVVQPPAPQPAATTAPQDPSPAQAPAASSSVEPAKPANVQWIGGYLSLESRLRILAQRADTSGDSAATAPASTDSTMPALQQQMDGLTKQLQGDQSTGLPSLADFLHALADQIGSAQRENFSFAISARGSFVSTSA
jgi:cell division septation protein DedD